MADKTVSELALQAQTDDQLKQELRADPASALAKEAAKAYTSDRKFYRIAILGLIGIILVVVVAAVVVQIWKGEDISSWVSAIATTALGGLVGLFAPPPTSSN
jgi:hypothetical protein